MIMTSCRTDLALIVTALVPVVLKLARSRLQLVREKQLVD